MTPSTDAIKYWLHCEITDYPRKTIPHFANVYSNLCYEQLWLNNCCNTVSESKVSQHYHDQMKTKWKLLGCDFLFYLFLFFIFMVEQAHEIYQCAFRFLHQVQTNYVFLFCWFTNSNTLFDTTFHFYLYKYFYGWIKKSCKWYIHSTFITLFQVILVIFNNCHHYFKKRHYYYFSFGKTTYLRATNLVGVRVSNYRPTELHLVESILSLPYETHL